MIHAAMSCHIRFTVLSFVWETVKRHYLRGVFNLKDFWSRHHAKVIGFLILAVIALCVISVIAIFGGVIMRIFGLEYDSIGSIILFFIIATIVSFPISMIAEGLPLVLFFNYQCPKQIAVIIYLVLDTIATAIGLSIVDYFMKSVTATNISIIVVSFILSLWSVKDSLEKPEGK